VGDALGGEDSTAAVHRRGRGPACAGASAGRLAARCGKRAGGETVWVGRRCAPKIGDAVPSVPSCVEAAGAQPAPLQKACSAGTPLRAEPAIGAAGLRSAHRIGDARGGEYSTATAHHRRIGLAATCGKRTGGETVCALRHLGRSEERPCWAQRRLGVGDHCVSGVERGDHDRRSFASASAGNAARARNARGPRPSERSGQFSRRPLEALLRRGAERPPDAEGAHAGVITRERPFPVEDAR